MARDSVIKRVDDLIVKKYDVSDELGTLVLHIKTVQNQMTIDFNKLTSKGTRASPEARLVQLMSDYIENAKEKLIFTQEGIHVVKLSTKGQRKNVARRLLDNSFRKSTHDFNNNMLQKINDLRFEGFLSNTSAERLLSELKTVHKELKNSQKSLNCLVPRFRGTENDKVDLAQETYKKAVVLGIDSVFNPTGALAFQPLLKVGIQ